MKLRSGDAALAVETAILLVQVRLGLTLKSLQAVQTRFLRSELPGLQASTNVPRLAKWVGFIACFVPGASCLTQGVAFQALLHRRGVPSELTLGVRRSSGGRLAAHAWVSVDGQVRLGGMSRRNAFSPIAKFGVGRQ